MKTWLPHYLGHYYGTVNVIYVVGGLVLITNACTAKYRLVSFWLRRISWFAGLLTVCRGMLGFVHDHWYLQLGSRALATLTAAGQTCGGGAVALLLLLLTSAEFWRLELSRKPKASVPAP